MDLKSKAITCTSSAKPAGQQLYTYASTRPLQVKGTFTCDVRAGRGQALADFFVITGKGIPLLCKQTATKMGMLKIGVYIAAVAETSQLLKQQYPEVFCGVDPEMKPVAQKEKDELAAIVAKSASASASEDDAAVEVTCLRQCLGCKESELEIMQGWLSKGEQATKHLEAERQRADQLASQLSKNSDEVGQLLERAVASEAALDTLEKQLKAVSQENEALGSLKEEMQQVSARSEILAAQVSILESTLQKRETELTRSHSELDVVKKENQELLAGCREATDTLTKAEKMAEGIAEVQAELKEKVSEVDRLKAQFQQKDTEIAELQTRIQPQVAAPVATGPSKFTRVEVVDQCPSNHRDNVDAERLGSL